jgi:hypothetical protein
MQAKSLHHNSQCEAIPRRDGKMKRAMSCITNLQPQGKNRGTPVGVGENIAWLR